MKIGNQPYDKKIWNKSKRSYHDNLVNFIIVCFVNSILLIINNILS